MSFETEQSPHNTITSLYVWTYISIEKGNIKVELHSKPRSITPVATKVHVILQGFVVLTWMCDAI